MSYTITDNTNYVEPIKIKTAQQRKEERELALAMEEIECIVPKIEEFMDNHPKNAMWYFTKEDLIHMYPDFSIEKHGELLAKRYRKAQFQAFINQYYQLVITLEDFFLPRDNPMYIDCHEVL